MRGACMEQKTFRMARQREVKKMRKFQDQSAAHPQLLKTQWKQQLSQQAAYKAEIHALHTEIANMNEMWSVHCAQRLRI